MAMATAELGLLGLSDGSASYSFNGYSVIAAVNGPVEVQRRDELPEEAAIDVIVRPAAGVGAIRERHLESLIHKVLRQVIRVQAHPRTLIQVTLQITSTPELDSVRGRLPQSASNLPQLPSLLNAALLALLNTSIPLESMYAATLVIVDSKGTIQTEPALKEAQNAASIHALCFRADGTLLLCESKGSFDLEEWINVNDQGSIVSVGIKSVEEKVNALTEMDIDEEAQTRLAFLRQTVIDRLRKHEAWRQAG